MDWLGFGTGFSMDVALSYVHPGRLATQVLSISNVSTSDRAAMTITHRVLASNMSNTCVPLADLLTKNDGSLPDVRDYRRILLATDALSKKKMKEIK